MKINNKTIKAAQRGELEAIDCIIDNYSNLAYYHSLQMIQDQFGAEDCAQESVEKIIKHIDEYDFDSSSFNTWAYTIINNTTLNYIKKNKRYKKRVVSNEEEVYNCCDNSFEKNELRLILSDIQRIVTEEEYTILILKLGHNYKFSEISKILNISESKVKRKYYEAIEKTNKFIEGNYEK